MKCPACGGKLVVIETRPDCESVYRRRKCVECGELIYTEETENPKAKSEISYLSKMAKIYP